MTKTRRPQGHHPADPEGPVNPHQTRQGAHPMSPTPRKPVDRTFRVLIDLPERWRSYITNDDRTCFEHDEPDDPWNQAAADREIARIEAEGCYLAGPADDPNEPELGRFGGIDGALITYIAHRHDVLDADTARGLWRFLAPNGEEYLLKTGHCKHQTNSL